MATDISGFKHRLAKMLATFEEPEGEVDARSRRFAEQVLFFLRCEGADRTVEFMRSLAPDDHTW